MKRLPQPVLLVGAVVVAVSDQNSALQALTSAALLLPGLASHQVKAVETNYVDFQYSHYQEGDRDLINMSNNRAPIEVDTIHLATQLALKDRIKLALTMYKIHGQVLPL